MTEIEASMVLSNWIGFICQPEAPTFHEILGGGVIAAEVYGTCSDLSVDGVASRILVKPAPHRGRR
jgi:hypothetical protein